jgi:hypothetical protein
MTVTDPRPSAPNKGAESSVNLRGFFGKTIGNIAHWLWEKKRRTAAVVGVAALGGAVVGTVNHIHHLEEEVVDGDMETAFIRAGVRAIDVENNKVQLDGSEDCDPWFEFTVRGDVTNGEPKDIHWKVIRPNFDSEGSVYGQTAYDTATEVNQLVGEFCKVDKN